MYKLTVVLLLSVLLFSCEKGDNENITNDFLTNGSWVAVDKPYDTLKFNADGTYLLILMVGYSWLQPRQGGWFVPSTAISGNYTRENNLIKFTSEMYRNDMRPDTTFVYYKPKNGDSVFKFTPVTPINFFDTGYYEINTKLFNPKFNRSWAILALSNDLLKMKWLVNDSTVTYFKLK